MLARATATSCRLEASCWRPVAKAFLPLELALLIFRGGLRRPGVRPLLVVGGLQRVNLIPHVSELSLCLVYGNLEWAGIETKKHLPATHAFIVPDVDFNDASGYIR